MANEVVNRRLNIYIDQAGAEQSLERLTKKENELLASIEKAKKANKDFTKELQQLGNTRTQIGQIKDVIDGKVLPSLKMAEAAVGSLRREIKRLPADSEAALKKLQELKKAEQTLGQVKNAVFGVNKAMSGLGSIADNALSVFLGGGLLGAVSTLTTAVKNFFSGALEEALKEEKAFSRLKNTLDNLGRNDVFIRLKQQADDLAESFGTFGNDDVIAVFEQLITYGKLTEQQITELTPVIIDFAAKSQISFSESASVIIKALEGNGKALKEYGIEITGAKNETEAFGIIMEELKPKVDGAAQAFGETTAGQIAKTREEIDALKGDIGVQLLPVMKAFYQSISDSIGAMKILFSSQTLSGFQKFKLIAQGVPLSVIAKIDRDFANANKPKEQAPGDVIDAFGRISRPGSSRNEILGLGGSDSKIENAKSGSTIVKKQLEDLTQKYKDFAQTIRNEAVDTEFGEIFAAFRKINEEAEKDIAKIQEGVTKGYYTAAQGNELLKLVDDILEAQRLKLQEKFKLNPVRIPVVLTDNSQTDTDLDAIEFGKKLATDLTKGITDGIAEDERVREVLQGKLELYSQWAGDVANIFVSISQIRNNGENAAFQREIAQNDERRKSYKRLLDGKVITQKEFDMRIAKLDEKEGARAEELRRKQFKRDQAAQVTQALMNGAQAVIATLAARPGSLDVISLGAFRAIQIGLITATTAAQVGAIKSQKFEKGGFIPNGSSHKQGGISLIDNRTGANVGEVEGGEPIISKSVYARNKPAIDAMLSAGWQNSAYQPINIPRLNQSMGMRYFADGGILPQPGQGDSSQELMKMLNQLNERLSYPLYAEVLYGVYEAKSEKINGIRNSGIIR